MKSSYLKCFRTFLRNIVNNILQREKYLKRESKQRKENIINGKNLLNEINYLPELNFSDTKALSLKDLSKAINSLDPKQRLIFGFYMGAYNTEEISIKTGLSINEIEHLRKDADRRITNFLKELM